MSGFVSLASQYLSGQYAKFLMETQVAVAKKVLDFNFSMQQELIQKLAQGGQTLQTNNPTNTGVFLDIRV